MEKMEPKQAVVFLFFCLEFQQSAQKGSSILSFCLRLTPFGYRLLEVAIIVFGLG